MKIIKKILKNSTFRVFLYSLGFCTLIFIFNRVADIYNMTTLHRCLCIISISLTHAFFMPLFYLFKEELHN